MADGRVIDGTPAVRVATGSKSHGRGQELLRVANEADTSVTTAAVGSVGHVGLEPLVMATVDGKTAFYSRPSTERMETIATTLEEETAPAGGAMAVVEHDPATPVLPTPETGPLSVGSRRVLGGCGWLTPTNVDEYTDLRDDLFTDRAKDDPESVRTAVMQSDLRGRGRGDASTDTSIAAEWTTVYETSDDPLVVVNGNEADDHADGDRLLLESAPLTVVDAALSSAIALRATDVVIYLSETETIAYERVQEAASALDAVTDTGIPIRVVTGPDEYTAGEPTMALEAIEGNHRIEARRQPPGPSEYGVNGRPTLIHTPRTFAQIGALLAGNGSSGASSDPGTRLITVADDDSTLATTELSTDATLDAALSAVELENGWHGACVGGVFGGMTRSLDVPASAPGLRSAHLGTNGVVELLGESTCMVALVGERATFAKETNCGRCVPCREGTKQLVYILRRVYDGEYKSEILRELARVMRTTSLCGFGRDASRPITTAMEEFETEFAAHAKGHCPTGICNQS
ncbi:NADH-ubiquinone oxidoreductase-F iron-sulfur binding region domain-containing protein [Halocatena pleomorpha]|uniref:NADH dehydrogenase FAD-containing subunit n=1 Tax=Halocatena pleomorpha TaxID=1785090 RepID=A0A3P3RDM3_9EURY|nr:NADH-ubiquinone oxidoreductase-F iron-sulfur binding region domain-containing protein [Halocatena pleomorpha]RRJ31495.1 NADH dehydrogenase FAD-containing subunit [Halocatena pleomorpha]